MLQRQLVAYTIFVVEQVSARQFIVPYERTFRVFFLLYNLLYKGVHWGSDTRVIFGTSGLLIGSIVVILERYDNNET